MVVPTNDTTTFKALLDMLVMSSCRDNIVSASKDRLPPNHVLFVGNTGVGKSVIIRDFLDHPDDREQKDSYLPIPVIFSDRPHHLTFKM